MLHELYTEWTEQTEELTRSIFFKLIGKFITPDNPTHLIIHYIHGIDEDSFNTISIIPDDNKIMKLSTKDIRYLNMLDYKIIDEARVIKLFSGNMLNFFAELVKMAGNGIIG